MIGEPILIDLIVECSECGNSLILESQPSHRVINIKPCPCTYTDIFNQFKEYKFMTLDVLDKIQKVYGTLDEGIRTWPFNKEE